MFTLFSGYESQMMGLLKAVKKFNNRFKAELVGWCEIDKAARLVHNLAFPEYADRCYPDVRAFYDEYIGFTYAMNVLGHGLICYFFFSIWKNTK